MPKQALFLLRTKLGSQVVRAIILVLQRQAIAGRHINGHPQAL